MIRIVLAVLTLIAFVAICQISHASEYYGTPIYYSKYVKDQYECRYAASASLGDCVAPSYPREAIIGYTNDDDASHGHSERVGLIADVVCIAGVCRDSAGAPYGRVPQREITYWSVPVGFYLDYANNTIWAQRHGTGQLAQVYPIRNVRVLPEYQDPPMGLVAQKTTGAQYDVYCNTVGDCEYLGIQMGIEDLSQYIPKVLTLNCSGWFCYNRDSTIAGINPRKRMKNVPPQRTTTIRNDPSIL